MAKAKSWAQTSLAEPGSLYLEVFIDPTGAFPPARFDVSYCTCTFARNEIPHAACVLAVGRSARDDSTAPINFFGSHLEVLAPCKLWFKPVGEWDPSGKTWPKGGPFLLFDGRFLGFSHRKAQGKLQVVATLIHWLTDMASSSVISSLTHQGSIMDLLYPAVQPGLGTGVNSPPVYLPEQLKLDLSDLEEVNTDLWGAIKDLLCQLAQQADLVDFPGETPCDDLSGGPNNQALAALKRIEGGGVLTEDCAREYELAKPLPLDTSILTIGSAIANHLMQLTLASAAHRTFWDLLVGEYCPTFQLALLPLVDRALLVADAPTNRHVWSVIHPEEYHQLDFDSYLARPLRGVAIVGDLEAIAGTNFIPQGSSEPAPKYLTGVAGCFQPEPAPEQGTVLFTAPPGWLALTPAAGYYVQPSTGAGGKPIHTATTPDSVGEEPSDPQPGNVMSQSRELYNRWAQAVYHTEMLRGRQGALVGKLRFDIAPGSVVRIAGSPERFLGAEDALAATWVGYVERVVVAINSEDPQASTSFEFSHLRTEEENEDESGRFSLSQHPLYGNHTVAGAPLIPQLAF